MAFVGSPIKLSVSKPLFWIINVLIIALIKIIIIPMAIFNLILYNSNQRFKWIIFEIHENLLLISMELAMKFKFAMEDEKMEVDPSVFREVFVSISSEFFSGIKKKKSPRIKVDVNGRLVMLANQFFWRLINLMMAAAMRSLWSRMFCLLSKGVVSNVMYQETDQNAVSEVNAAMDAGILVNLTNQVLEENADADQDMPLVP